MWRTPGTHSELNIGEAVFDKRRGDRPSSNTHTEFKSNLPSKSRPRSALKRVKQHSTSGLLRNRSKLTVQEDNYTLLTKLKPRVVKAEKERLYEDILALKQENNQLREENVRLKTKLSTLDRELGRFEDTIYDLKGQRSPAVKKTQALVSLKQGIRELKQNLEDKDREISELKKNIKSTKVTELEAEVQAYVDECVRLRRHFEEKERQLEQQLHKQELTEQVKHENKELLKELETLRVERDNWEKNSKSLVKKKSVRKRSPGNVKKLKRSLQDASEIHRHQVERYEAEVNSLRAECERLKGSTKALVPAKPLNDLIKIEVNYVPSDDHSDASPNTGQAGLGERLQVPAALPQEAMPNANFLNSPNSTDNKELTSILEEDTVMGLTPELKANEAILIAEAEVTEIITHLRYRVQLHRVSRSDLSLSLRELIPESKQANAHDIAELLFNDPFSIEDLDSRLKLIAYLCPSSLKTHSRKLSRQDIERATIDLEEFVTNLLKQLGEWGILSLDDEARFDQRITEVMQHNQFTLLESCKLYDEDLKGVITLKQFEEVLENLDLEFTKTERKYMELLFYSHDSQLDAVPYQQFIKAYSTMKRPEESYDDETRTALVKAVLQSVATALKTQKLTVMEVFQGKNGLVDANEIVSAFARLKIPELNHNELFTFIEGLAAENEEDLCINTEYLEELLSFYGVPLFTKEEKLPRRKRSSSRGSMPQFSTKTYESSINKSIGSDFLPPKFDSNLESERQENISMLDSPDLTDVAISNPGFSEASLRSKPMDDRSPFFR